MHATLQNIVTLALPSLRQTFGTHLEAVASTLSCVVSFLLLLDAVFADTVPPHIPTLTGPY